MPGTESRSIPMTLRRAVRFTAFAVGASIACATFAQQNAAPAASPIPTHSCVKPGEFPGRLASETQQKTWQKDFVAYIDCLKKFVTEQQALADPHVKAANAAVDEYNRGVKDYNDQIKKAKDE
jgi:hypothetical protein